MTLSRLLPETGAKLGPWSRLAPLRRCTVIIAAATAVLAAGGAGGQEERETHKPALHGKNWVAITGKPLAATAGALTFARGGNAVDAACAMLAAAATMWDTLHWGGETQALIFDPRSGAVRAINALGVAPTGATPEFFRSRGMRGPPEYGPLAAVTPGTPGGLLVMLAEFGTLSLAEVLEPAMQMAAGYPMEQTQTVEHRGQQGAARALGVVAARAVAEPRPGATASVGRAVAGARFSSSPSCSRR